MEFEHSNDARKTIWLRLFRTVVAIAVAIALFYTVRSSAQQFLELDFKLSSLNYWMLALSMACYFAAMVLSCVFWKFVLTAFDCHCGWSRSLWAFFLSQLGKYVPGKLMVIVIRTDLIRDDATNIGRAAASVFVETLTWIFVGSVIASVLIAFKFTGQPVLQWTAVSLALIAGILTIPPVFAWLAAKLTRVSDSRTYSGLTFRTMLFGWLLMGIGWCLNGWSLWLVLASLPETNMELPDFTLALACVSLATVAGFVSMLPGGIGVRELVMIPLLGPRYGIAIAIVAAILIRLVWLSAELLSSGIIYLLKLTGVAK